MSEHSAPAGWYAHPSMADTQRYWDGSDWTDHVAPGLPQNVQAATVQTSEHQANQTLILVGLLLGFLLPIVGLIVGCILLAKRAAGAGVVVILVSIGSVFVWYGLLLGG